MTQKMYTAFFPDAQVWCGSGIDYSVSRNGEWLREQMAEVIFKDSSDSYELRICRDGQVLIHVPKLENEKEEASKAESYQAEKGLRVWGKYLDYLNVYFMLLDSATGEIQRAGIFELNELTKRNTFRVRFENDKHSGKGNTNAELRDYEPKRYLEHYGSSHNIASHRDLNRSLIKLDTIRHAAKNLKFIAEIPGAIKLLSIVSKSFHEYKIGNYETSIILAWLVVETTLLHLWTTKLEAINETYSDGSKRINKDRNKLLTGRDFSASSITNMLELSDDISFNLFNTINTARGYRNSVVHNNAIEITANKAQTTINAALLILDRAHGIQFQPSFSYSLTRWG